MSGRAIVRAVGILVLLTVGASAALSRGLGVEPAPKDPAPSMPLPASKDDPAVALRAVVVEQRAMRERVEALRGIIEGASPAIRAASPDR